MLKALQVCQGQGPNARGSLPGNDMCSPAAEAIQATRVLGLEAGPKQGFFCFFHGLSPVRACRLSSHSNPRSVCQKIHLGVDSRPVMKAQKPARGCQGIFMPTHRCGVNHSRRHFVSHFFALADLISLPSPVFFFSFLQSTGMKPGSLRRHHMSTHRLTSRVEKRRYLTRRWRREQGMNHSIA